MQRIVLTGASGYLGRYLTHYFSEQGWEVVVVARHEPIDLPPGVHFEIWDGKTLGNWAESIDGANAVVNLAGRSVNCRYNDENKREIYVSRLQSTRVVGQAIAKAKNPPKAWLNASSATIYRKTYRRANTEADGVLGEDFSVDVCRQWEATLNEADLPATRRVRLRSAMVFGPGKGGVWEAFSALVKIGFGGPMAGGRQYVSWIHIHDFARSIAHIIKHPELEGPVNIASPFPIRNAQFLAAIRRAFKIPYSLPTARWQLGIGALAKGTESELLLKSRRVVPEKLTQSGFEFEFPKWDGAAHDIAAHS